MIINCDLAMVFSRPTILSMLYKCLSIEFLENLRIQKYIFFFKLFFTLNLNISILVAQFYSWYLVKDTLKQYIRLKIQLPILTN